MLRLSSGQRTPPAPAESLAERPSAPSSRALVMQLEWSADVCRRGRDLARSRAKARQAPGKPHANDERGRAHALAAVRTSPRRASAQPRGTTTPTSGGEPKFRSPSSGCNSRPGRMQPHHPAANLATTPATGSAMRRYASAWAVHEAASKREQSLEAEGFEDPRRRPLRCPEEGRGSGASGEVDEHGTCATDDPATWETLARLRATTRCPGDPVTTLRRAVRTRVRARPAEPQGSAQNQHPHRGRSLARGTGAAIDAGQGVGGPNMSCDAGEPIGTGTRSSEGGPCRT